MKYEVGQKVKIKSLDWYNENKDPKHGLVYFGHEFCFYSHMSKYCGKTLTISEIVGCCYVMAECVYNNWTDEMIEGLVEEDIIYIDKFQDNNEMIDIIDECVHRLKDNECQINLPEGYIFKDENGNVINATKIVLEKKKKEYPKTYEECSLINGCEDRIPLKIIGEFTRLINARNAYWKVYGEEMGLGKPWEPDYRYKDEYYSIYYNGFGIIQCNSFQAHVFIFPTEEMRDAFYENFKKEIEQCKELL